MEPNFLVGPSIGIRKIFHFIFDNNIIMFLKLHVGSNMEQFTSKHINIFISKETLFVLR